MYFIERIKKDIEVVKSLKSKKEKITFIWDYYKFPIVVISGLLLFSVVSAVNSASKGKNIMTVALVNSAAEAIECDDSIFSTALENGGVDLKGKTVEVIGYLNIGEESSENQEDLMVLNAMFTLGDMDIFVAEKKTFDLFVDKEAYLDLRQYLDENLLNKYAADLYEYENEAGDKVVLGIYIHNGSLIHNAGYYNGDVIISIASRSENIENAITFFLQLRK